MTTSVIAVTTVITMTTPLANATARDADLVLVEAPPGFVTGIWSQPRTPQARVDAECELDALIASWEPLPACGCGDRGCDVCLDGDDFETAEERHEDIDDARDDGDAGEF